MQPLLTRFDDNPLIKRLGVREPRLSARRAFVIAFGIGVSGLVLGIAGVQASYWRALEAGWWGLWAMVVSVPLLVALVAVLHTQRDMQRGAYQLLYLSTLPDERLVRGYVAAVLYQARLPIAVMVGVMPLHVVTAFFMLVRINAQVANVSPYITPAPPSRFEILLPTLAFMLLSIMLWSLNGLAALIGVYSALTRQGLLAASFQAIFLVVLATAWLTAPVWVSLLVPQIIQLTVTLCAPAAYVGGFTIIWEAASLQASQAIRRPFDT